MEVNFRPEAESRLRELAEETGRTPADLIEDAMAGHLREPGIFREMPDSRYEDLHAKEDRPGRLAKFHVAEYDALTSRITYYVTLQYSTWAIAAVLFGYLAPLGLAQNNHRNFEWTGVLCILAVGWAALHINYEILVIVSYLINILLPALGADYRIKNDVALGFEGWIRRRGGRENIHRNVAPNILFILGAGILLILLLSDIVCNHLAISEIWWIVICGPLAGFVGWKAWAVLALLKRLDKDVAALSPSLRSKES
jgi:hypothetical protein